jgi:hypothetical protein
MRGLIPRISLGMARRCLADRDGRDKPGHDTLIDFEAGLK